MTNALFRIATITLLATSAASLRAQTAPDEQLAAVSEAEARAAQQPGEQDDAGFWSQFIDPEDNNLDLSKWLIQNAYGFLPIPIIITEPALDNGLGLAGAFFHKPKADAVPDEAGPVTGVALISPRRP